MIYRSDLGLRFNGSVCQKQKIYWFNQFLEGVSVFVYFHFTVNQFKFVSEVKQEKSKLLFVKITNRTPRPSPL